MSTLDAFDYSWSRPDPPTMAAAGIKAVGRYLWDGGKGVTVAEIKALWAAGIGVWLGYEANSGNHLLGAAQGTRDGVDARRLLAELSEIIPAGAPIYFACDQQVSDSMLQVVLAYLNAAKAQSPGASCYAQASVVDAWGPAWQTLAWSGGRVSANAVIYQWQIDQGFHGSSVDYNQIMNPAGAGIFWPPGHTPEGGGTVITPPVTPSLPTPIEDDMPSYFVPGKIANGQPSGHNWIVAPGLASRTVAVDAGNWQTIANDPARTDVVNADMTYAQLVAIPDVSTSSNGHQGAT